MQKTYLIQKDQYVGLRWMEMHMFELPREFKSEAVAKDLAAAEYDFALAIHNILNKNQTN